MPRRVRPGSLGVLVVLALVACDGPPATVAFTVNATLVPTGAEGLRPAGRVDEGAAILPDGRRITPLGRQLELGGFLLGMRVLPGGSQLLVTDGSYYDENLYVVDLATGAIVQRLAFTGDQSLFLGLAIRADGRVYASGGGGDRVHAFAYDASSPTPLTALPEADVIEPPGSFVAGLAFADDTRLVVALEGSGGVDEVDTATGTDLGVVALGGRPYDVAVDRDRAAAYVSLWGGGAVAVIDLAGAAPALATKIAVGKNPEALLLAPAVAPTRLLVANSDSDSISVIALASGKVTATVAVGAAPTTPRGAAPDHLGLSPDGERLYVANAGENCVDVRSARDLAPLGRFPTAWYPTAIAALPSGGLAIANAKGMGGGPSSGQSFDYGIMKGTLSILAAPPSDGELARLTAAVKDDDERATEVGPTVRCPVDRDCRWPLPPRPGLATPIEHVVLVVRENKTYDAALGDLAGADGDPALAMFGERYTPNLHALARAFVNGDNFYSDAEASIQGHQWTSGGTTNDFTEKAWLTTWGRGQRPVTDFAKPIAFPERGYYFQHLAAAGVDYIDYGEIVGFAADGPIVNYDPSWPGGLAFNLDSKDVVKAEYLRTQILDLEALPRFTYVVLPNNHTEGLTPGKWTPEYMVADNDEATGRIVDILSHSTFWPTTAVFIIEDDPQDGADHVEAHRSTLVVASPWVRHGAVVRSHYDVASLWRTIELLVGMPPQTLATSQASPMFDLWASEPDLTPYDAIPAAIPEARNPGGSGRLVRTSEQMDLSTVDRAPGLGRILWQHMKGAPAPWSSMPLPADWDGDVDEAD